MSKSQKVLFQRYFSSQKYLDSQKVSKPTGDQEKPSFGKSMQTTIVGVELEEIALEEKLEKDLKNKSKENEDPILKNTYDPHHLVQVESKSLSPESQPGQHELRSRDNLPSIAGELERESRGKTK